MKKFNLAIKWRLTIWYGAVLSLILIIFASGIFIYFKNSLQESIDAKIRSIGEVLSSSMTDTHNTSVFGNFERYLENVLGKKPKGKFIQIMDSSGRIGAKMSDTKGKPCRQALAPLKEQCVARLFMRPLKGQAPASE